MYSVNLEKEKSISVFVIGKKKKTLLGLALVWELSFIWYF